MNADIYHAIGNKYIVIEPQGSGEPPTPEQIQKICHPNFGLGSDGILFGPLSSNKAHYALQIFNPDGSEAEKSGNGIRIFSRYLYEKGLVKEEPFLIDTKGGVVEVRVFDAGKTVEVDMGMVSFLETSNNEITVKGKTLKFNAATIGNPHCVIFLPEISPELAKKYGPHIEKHSYFPNKTNVQFVRIKNRKEIDLEIWERGAGYTLSSGSSSCAAVAVARKLDLCDQDVIVHMPGGDLSIHVKDDYSVKMTGSVTKIAEGTISQEVFNKD